MVATIKTVVLAIVAPVLGLTAAALAALMVVPAPSHQLALVAVGISEKSFVTALAGIVTVLLAIKVMDTRARWVAVAAALLGIVAFGLSFMPPAQALMLARERGISLDVGRYLTAAIVHEQGEAPFTVPYHAVGGRTLELAVYPAAKTGELEDARRVVLVVHGGGWSAGNKGETARLDARLATLGYHVFALDYRLAPDARWKDMIADIKCAIGWLKRNPRVSVGERGLVLDTNRITLLGRSAGGHLALLAAFTATDPALPPGCPAPDTTVDSVVSFYAPTDLVWGYANPTRPAVYDSRARLRGLLDGPPESVGDTYERASPTTRAHAKSPPVLLLHGGRDQFASPLHLEWLQLRLQALKVPNEALLIPYAQHGFDHILGGLSSQLAEATLVRFLADTDRRKQ